MTSLIAFPDACRTGCGPFEPSAGCCSADWTNCSWSQSCGIDWALKEAFYTGIPEEAKTFTRHLGGSNLGFADGHAKWWPAGSILSESPTIFDTNAGTLRGAGCWIPYCG
jgi:prepilin-type processing-associated H-X9-DG protein